MLWSELQDGGFSGTLNTSQWESSLKISLVFSKLYFSETCAYPPSQSRASNRPLCLSLQCLKGILVYSLQLHLQDVCVYLF